MTRTATHEVADAEPDAASASSVILPGWIARLSPTGFGVLVGVYAAVLTAVSIASTAVFVAYTLAGADAITGQVSEDTSGRWTLWTSESARLATVQSAHTAMMVWINWAMPAALAVGVPAGLIARRVRRDQARASAERVEGRAAAAQAAVWETVAEDISDTEEERYRRNLVDAARRLLHNPVGPQGQPAPVYEGDATGELPAASRFVRVYGPVASGKSLCARRLIRQEVDRGHHVTVIRSGANALAIAEYEFDDDIDTDLLTVIDAETLTTVGAQRVLAAKLSRRNDRKEGLSRPDETVVIDVPVDGERLRELVTHLAEAILGPGSHSKLVVLVSGHKDLAELDGLFDTEIVLPGRASSRTAPHPAVRQALTRLSDEELTLARLEAKVRGGGRATSVLEEVIAARAPEYCRPYLRRRMTQIDESAQPSTAGLQHGILKAPDGDLAEFTLPAEPFAGISSSPAPPESRRSHEME